MKQSTVKKTGGSQAAKLHTLQDLREARARLKEEAKAHALKTALEYYRCHEDTLRKFVFDHWLTEHAFRERFKPMGLLG